ncbi:hypothetical protein C5167_022166 [Papaver somniferum]|uniref:Amidase domain-containing protein n=1 Tax=Papaver somniferum TaxID=3469 RepID=A0A4Y7JKZ4_PAPSO|nr:hypothetical protein C5167_022166 [Papaver somniferum]
MATQTRDSGGEFNEKNEKIKESATEEEVKEVSPLKNALKYFDAKFFSDEKVLEMGKGAKDFNVPIYRANRKLVASEDGGLHDPSVLVFNPEWSSRSSTDAKTSQNIHKRFSCPTASGVQKPNLDEDVALMNVFELGHLLKTKQTTSQELTEIFLRRMKKYDHALEAVISYTEELAFKQAKRADDLLNQGVLKAAGAVLIAKLVTGSLAYDDIWFGGRTRNPWNIEEFSTGSSAGPAASTSAGLVPFAVGSETAGSMTYPAARCGVTAIRPTFGMVGRTGVMSLSESLVVNVLASKGVNVIPFKLNYTVDSVQGILNFTMDVDTLSHFDSWQRTGQDDVYEAQDQWPLELRRARMVPAVDYLQAQRARGKLIREIRESFTVDAFIGNATDWERVCMGNLVGMPVVVVPTGFKSIKNPPSGNIRRRTTVTTGIYAPPQHDHVALALAIAYQSVTDHHKQRPPIDDLGPDDSILNHPKADYPPRRWHL